MPEIDVTLNDRHGAPIGNIKLPDIGAWVELPPEMAAKVVDVSGQWTADMFTSGQLAALMCVTAKGEMQYVVGQLITAAVPEPTSDRMGAMGNLECDAYVLKADGSVES
jgi:hypothetical protein